MMVDHHQQLQKEYNIYSSHRVAMLVCDLPLPSVANTACFVLLNTLSCFAEHFRSLCSLLTCRRLTESFLLCFGQYLESLCSLLTCVDCVNNSCFVLLNTFSHSAHS